MTAPTKSASVHMSDWTGGYVADIGYTFGYYTELNPQRLRLPFLYQKLAPPDVGTACELGFGQGMSVNLHAAASDTKWNGTDFNPSQAAFAQHLARESGSQADLTDQAFEQFCARTDLPDFDYIGLHGIWSWISDTNRAVIVDFIARKLKVGGVLYISYNTQPGWAAMVPLRDLLTEHSNVMGSSGQGVVPRIDAALEFADRLMATNPHYAKANPQVAERLQKLKGQDRNYLAHEYFNRDWLPMPISRMAEWLTPAKLSYACSANLLDHVDAIHLTVEQQALIAGIPDPLFRQTVRDFCVNQQFRKDYWVKGPRKLSGIAQVETLRAQRVLLVMARADVPLKANSALGAATLHENIYGPILDALADHRPRSLAELEQSVADKSINFAQVVQALMVLNGIGAVDMLQDPAVAARAEPRTTKLNAFLCEHSRGSTELSYLASTLTGGGVTVDRFQQLFLLARRNGARNPADWARFTWKILEAQGQRLQKDGVAIESAEENLAMLTTKANLFVEKQLPILAALGIAKD